MTWDDRLQAAARVQAKDQSDHLTLSHDGSDGSNSHERAARAGWSGPASENLKSVAAYHTPYDITQWWYESPIHKLAMMQDSKEPEFAGVGIYFRESLSKDAKWTAGRCAMLFGVVR